MPGGFIYPTFSVGMIDNQRPTSVELDDTILHPSRWAYQRRSVSSTWDQYKWDSLWPSGTFMSGDPTSPVTLFGDDSAFGGVNFAFEISSVGTFGTQSVNFLLGTCLDSNSNPVANPIVQGFRSVDDVFVGQVTANNDGTYTLGTANSKSTTHYVVAYKAGSPDIAGTTVNTLLPTNVDGS